MNSTRDTIFLPIISLSWRELVRFYRQKARIIGSLGTPILFWLFLGSGLQAAFPDSTAGVGFLKFFFPGNLVLTLLFTSIFTNISIIEDRREGFLQSVLVAPVSRFSIVGGKVWGGSLIAFFQGCLFLLLAPFAGITFSVLGLFMTLFAMLLIAVTLTTLGFFFAWKLDSVQGFHSIMNLLLMPMWLLSGAFFPISKAPFILKWIVFLNPLTYGFSALQSGLYYGGDTQAVMGYGPSILIILIFGAGFYFMSLKTVLTKKKGSV